MPHEFLANHTPGDVAAAYVPEAVVPVFDDVDAQAIRTMYEGSGYEMHFSSRTIEEGVTVGSVLQRLSYARRQALEAGSALPGPVFDFNGRLIPGVGLWTVRPAVPDGTPR